MQTQAWLSGDTPHDHLEGTTHIPPCKEPTLTPGNMTYHLTVFRQGLGMMGNKKKIKTHTHTHTPITFSSYVAMKVSSLHISSIAPSNCFTLLPPQLPHGHTETPGEIPSPCTWPTTPEADHKYFLRLVTSTSMLILVLATRCVVPPHHYTSSTATIFPLSTGAEENPCIQKPVFIPSRRT